MTVYKYTPEQVAFLRKNEIFVFGSNIEGHHMGGAAKVAHEKFGAIWGVGNGLMGKSYAIPTMYESVEEIKPFVEQFIQTANLLPARTFLLTKVGCGIAGFSEDEIKPLFDDAPANVIKPEGW